MSGPLRAPNQAGRPTVVANSSASIIDLGTSIDSDALYGKTTVNAVGQVVKWTLVETDDANEYSLHFILKHNARHNGVRLLSQTCY